MSAYDMNCFQYSMPTFSRASTADNSVLITEQQRCWRDDALEEWGEMRAFLPQKLEQLAQEFVRLCDDSGAFFCSPGCSVDHLEDGSVMFDWNDSALPIFTTMITVEMQVIHVGHFSDGKIKGEGHGLSFVEMHLDRFVREREGSPWNIFVSSESFVRKSAVEMEIDPKPPFTLPPLMETFPYTDVTAPMDETWLKQGDMLPNN